jgi:hypothetical protein
VDGRVLVKGSNNYYTPFITIRVSAASVLCVLRQALLHQPALNSYTQA